MLRTGISLPTTFDLSVALEKWTTEHEFVEKEWEQFKKQIKPLSQRMLGGSTTNPNELRTDDNAVKREQIGTEFFPEDNLSADSFLMYFEGNQAFTLPFLFSEFKEVTTATGIKEDAWTMNCYYLYTRPPNQFNNGKTVMVFEKKTKNELFEGFLQKQKSLYEVVKYNVDYYNDSLLLTSLQGAVPAFEYVIHEYVVPEEPVLPEEPVVPAPDIIPEQPIVAPVATVPTVAPTQPFVNFVPPVVRRNFLPPPRLPPPLKRPSPSPSPPSSPSSSSSSSSPPRSRASSSSSPPRSRASSSSSSPRSRASSSSSSPPSSPPRSRASSIDWDTPLFEEEDDITPQKVRNTRANIKKVSGDTESFFANQPIENTIPIEEPIIEEPITYNFEETYKFEPESKPRITSEITYDTSARQRGYIGSQRFTQTPIKNKIDETYKPEKSSIDKELQKLQELRNNKGQTGT